MYGGFYYFGVVAAILDGDDESMLSRFAVGSKWILSRYGVLSVCLGDEVSKGVVGWVLTEGFEGVGYFDVSGVGASIGDCEVYVCFCGAWLIGGGLLVSTTEWLVGG